MRKACRLLCTLLAAVLLVSSTPVQTVAKTTKEKLEDAEKEKEKTEKDIKDAKDDVGRLNSQQKKLEARLTDLTSELERIAERLNALDEQIREKQKEIEDSTLALEEATRIEEEQYASMKKRIQFMYEKSTTLYLDVIFNAKSFSDFLNLYNYIDSISKYDNEKFEEYQANRHSIEQLKAHLEEEKGNLDLLMENVSLEKEAMDEVINKTKGDIKSYDSKIDDAEAALLEKERKLKEQETNISKLKKQYEEELEKSKRSRESKWRSIGEVTFSEGDRMLLANLIYCEAGGEPYDGQVAVGSVVINRLLSSVFPDTLSGVIYQKSQFSPAASGRLAYALSVDKATDSCYKAADEAMSGYTNVGTCVFFRTPVPGLTGIQIGNHIFY
ncbi:MAG: cell wall hydrolase [Lachnospiraceae bacterium]|nr:cell wall hydrolase [Lachnospiraceae bacterium]